MSADLNRTVLLTVDARASTGALDEAAAKLDALKAKAEDMESKDVADSVLGRGEDGLSDFERMLAARQKPDAEDNGAAPAEAITDQAEALEGLASKATIALGAIGALGAVMRSVIGNNEALMQSWGTLTTTVTELWTETTALAGQGGPLSALADTMDRVSVSLGGMTEEAKANAEGMTGLEGTTKVGTKAMEDQLDVLQRMAEAAKIAREEIERLRDLQASIRAGESDEERRMQEAEREAIDAMPEGLDKQRALASQAELEASRKRAARAVASADETEAQMQKIDLLEAEAEELQKTADEAARLEAAAKRKSLEQAKLNAERGRLRDMGRSGASREVLEAQADVVIDQEQALEEASRAARGAGSAEEARERRAKAQEEADKRRAEAARLRQDEEVRQLIEQGEEASLGVDETNAANQRSRSLNEQREDDRQKARERIEQERLEEAEALRESMGMSAAAHGQLGAAVVDMSRSHAQATQGVARRVQDAAQQAQRVASEVGGYTDLEGRRQDRRRDQAAWPLSDL